MSQRNRLLFLVLVCFLLCTCAAAFGASSTLALYVFDVGDRISDLWWMSPSDSSDGDVPVDAGSSERPPDFTATDLEGRTWTLDDLRGRPVVINFWATWCPPCREELPQLQRLSDEYHDEGLIVLLVDVQEDESTVRKYLAARSIDLPCIVDTDGRLSRSFRVNSLPTNVLIRPDGSIGGRIIGWQGADHLQRGIEHILP